MQVQNANAFSDYLNLVLGEGADRLSALIGQILIAFERKPVRKNEVLVREGETCRFFCFVESGILQHSVLVSGEEKTTYLALRQSVTSSLNSFLHKVPSRKSVRAIADGVIWTINLETFQKLLKDNPAFRQFYHNLIERQICLIDDYRIDLLTMTPEERYQKLLATEPKLLREVPLHYLASFLGISARHMSRIRQNAK